VIQPLRFGDAALLHFLIQEASSFSHQTTCTMLLCIDLLMSLLLCSFLLHTNAWAMPSSKIESTQPLQKQRGAVASSRRWGLRMYSFVRQLKVSTHALSLQLSYMTLKACSSNCVRSCPPHALSLQLSYMTLKACSSNCVRRWTT
jgi:hypothetical protein